MANQPKKYKKFVATAATATLVASAIVPVAASAATPKFPDVGSDYADAVNAIADLGIVSGYTDGTFKPLNTVNRAGVVKFLGKFLVAQGAKLPTYEAATANGFPFSDLTASADKELVQYAALVKAEGVFTGYTDGTLNPTQEITRTQMASVLVKAIKAIYDIDLIAEAKAANFVSDITDIKGNVYEEAISALDFAGLTVATQYNPGGTLNRGQFANFLSRSIDFVADFEASKEAKVESVSAINAKTLKVEFNTAVDTTKATIEAKRGSVKPSVKEIKFSEDKKSATIEFSTAMAAGDYTVSVSGLTEKALTGTVKVEAEKLTKINFLTDIAVISGDDVVTTVTAENQYGELITKKLNTSNTNITGTTSKGSSVSIDNDGRLTVAGSAGLFKADDKVVVTVVDSATGVTATKTLTVAQAASVQSITTGEFKTDDKELAAKPLNVANYDSSKFYLPVEIKDQYGNVLKAADLNGSVTVTSSNREIVNPASTVFVDTDNGVVAKFTTAPTAQTHGTAVLTFVAAATGKTASASVTIKENYKLDTVTLEAPASELKLTKATELPISITNSYGETVALKDVAVGGTSTALTLDSNTTINAIGATLSVEQDYVNKKAVLKVTPTAKNVTLTLVTATGKSQVLGLTANDEPVVAGIKGLSKDFVSLLANDTDLSTDLDGNVEFVDQYGETISAPSFDNSNDNSGVDFEIVAKDSNNAVTTYSNGDITASTTAGTETYQVLLKEDAKVLDTFEVTVSVVDADKLTQFGIADLNKFYTGGTSAAHDQQVTVHGLLDGKKVLIDQDMVKNVTASNGLVIATDGAYTASTIATDAKDVASTVTVLVANTDNTYTLTKDVVYNDAAPKATKVELELDDKAVSDVVQITPANTDNIVTTGTDGLRIFATDQYGVELETGYNFVVTNNSTDATISVDTDGVVTVTGTPTAGKSFTLNVTINGISKSIKVIIG